MIQAIALPTDFSPGGTMAFQHALRLALEFRCRLDLLHVRDAADEPGWSAFPHVRDTLTRWQLLPPGASIEQISEQLGVTIRKVDIKNVDAVTGICNFLAQHRPDLLVMASHGRKGINRWLSGSISNEVATTSDVPTLLFGPQAKPFVDTDTGILALTKAVIAVDHEPAPGPAYLKASDILEALNLEAQLIYAGKTAPFVDAAKSVDTVEGDAVEVVVAASRQAHLLVMPTAGQHGFLDMLRGSTTEQVLHDAACPVLAIPTR